jgi:hypothetical protein
LSCKRAFSLKAGDFFGLLRLGRSLDSSSADRIAVGMRIAAPPAQIPAGSATTIILVVGNMGTVAQELINSHMRMNSLPFESS